MLPQVITEYFIRPTALRVHPLYSSLSMILSTIFLSLIPLAALTFFNLRIRGVINQRNRDTRTMNRKQKRKGARYWGLERMPTIICTHFPVGMNSK